MSFLPIVLVHGGGGRPYPRRGGEHDPRLLVEVLLPGRHHRVEHGLVQEVEAHPFAHYHVHLLGEVNVLSPALNHLNNYRCFPRVCMCHVKLLCLTLMTSAALFFSTMAANGSAILLASTAYTLFAPARQQNRDKMPEPAPTSMLGK